MIYYLILDWRQCTKTMDCSAGCVTAYVHHYGARCAGKTRGRRQATCEDFARVHNGGPNGCRWVTHGQNGCSWVGQEQNGCRWIRQEQNGCSWVEHEQNGCRWVGHEQNKCRLVRYG